MIDRIMGMILGRRMESTKEIGIWRKLLYVSMLGIRLVRNWDEILIKVELKFHF